MHDKMVKIYHSFLNDAFIFWWVNIFFQNHFVQYTKFENLS